jgi:peptidoglycan/LPS O-acetylase OafA/YrhL
MERERLPELDLLRFLAAAGVVMYHATRWPSERGLLFDIFRFGFMGVPLFFTISGFVILMTAENRNGLQFINSRISRLYPSYWICVLLTTVALATLGGGLPPIGTIAANLSMQPRMVFDRPYLDNVYWTLAIEMKFYALMFLLIVIHQIKRVEWFLLAWLALAAFGNIVTVPNWLDAVTMPWWASLFISGCYFYLIRSRGPTLARFAGLGASVLLSMFASRLYLGGYTTANEASQLAVDAIILLINAAFLLVALRKWALPSARIWLWLGCLTYPLYLTHSKMGHLVWGALPGGDWTRVCIVLALVLAVSALLAIFVERRLCSAFNKFLNRSTERLLARVRRKQESEAEPECAVQRSFISPRVP